ncbi:hypothetical protein SISSUDRAFT_1056013 [Sistotremastrum suecicum HHB10207 ss-3]|uniref:Uncharacterized protein n=1 Tax=Sistotremastrum suecicum HHB10207 ss-3 TaxID=1314776 RepID=A0A165XCU2_9AGAM|nr:hypothetical protein SISSUDRAFT_1056013 [Sistotremastrum suecicum HHB10207 ss-3]
MNLSNTGDPFKARTWELTVHRTVDSETIEAFISKPELHGLTEAVIDATFAPDTVASPSSEHETQEIEIAMGEQADLPTECHDKSSPLDATVVKANVKANPIPEISALQLSDDVDVSGNAHVDKNVPAAITSCDHPQQLHYTRFSKAYRGLGNLPRNPMNFQEWYESFGCCARETPGIAPNAKGVKDGDLVLHRYGAGSQVWYRSSNRQWVPMAIGDFHPASGRYLKYDQYGVISLIKEAGGSAPPTPQRSGAL